MIEAGKDKYPLTMMCKQLGVSRSGYYARQERGPSRHQQKDEELVVHIKKSHAGAGELTAAPGSSMTSKRKAFRWGGNEWLV